MQATNDNNDRKKPNYIDLCWMKSYLDIVVDSKNAGTNWTLKENSQPTNARKPRLNIKKAKQGTNNPNCHPTIIQTVIQLSCVLSLYKVLSKASINHGVYSVQLIDGNGSPEIQATNHEIDRPANQPIKQLWINQPVQESINPSLK